MYVCVCVCTCKHVPMRLKGGCDAVLRGREPGAQILPSGSCPSEARVLALPRELQLLVQRDTAPALNLNPMRQRVFVRGTDRWTHTQPLNRHGYAVLLDIFLAAWGVGNNILYRLGTLPSRTLLNTTISSGTDDYSVLQMSVHLGLLAPTPVVFPLHNCLSRGFCIDGIS